MYYLCSENKAADQLHGHREADLRLCFRLCKKPVFSQRGSYSAVVVLLLQKTALAFAVKALKGIVVTGPGKLNCKYIFHVMLQNSVKGWKTVISNCLQLAETRGVTSLSFPALGTGMAFSFNIT